MSNRHASFRPHLNSALTELLQIRDTHGSLDRNDYRFYAKRSGYSVRHLQRCVAGRIAAEPNPDEESFINADVIEHVFRCNGNLSKAHRLLQRNGCTVPSLSTFRRKVINSLGTDMLAYAKNGPTGLRTNRVYMPRTPETRGYTYFLDHTECPIYVIPDGHRTAERPMITTVMDAETRYVLSWVITFGTPTAEEVRASLISAITQRVAPDGQTVVGGAPERCLWDRGLEFLAELTTESCQRLDIVPVPLPGYSPHLKAALERFWRFFKEDALGHLPGYIDASHNLDGSPMLAKAALSQVAFVTEVEKWMDWYNTEHVNSSLGSTALDAWINDTAPLRPIPFEELWFGFLIGKPAKVGNSGVRHKGIDYLAVHGELDDLFGRTVEVRYLPRDKSFIEVFRDGKHIATCYPAGSLRPDEQLEFLAARKAAQREAAKNHTTSNRLRSNTPGAQKLTKGKGPNGKKILKPIEAEPDLFIDRDEALKSFRPSTEDEGLF